MRRVSDSGLGACCIVAEDDGPRQLSLFEQRRVALMRMSSGLRTHFVEAAIHNVVDSCPG